MGPLSQYSPSDRPGVVLRPIDPVEGPLLAVAPLDHVRGVLGDEGLGLVLLPGDQASDPHHYCDVLRSLRHPWASSLPHVTLKIHKYIY